MRIRLTLFVLLLGLSTLAFGQKFQGGVFGGINASRIDNDSYSGYGKLGLNGGAFVGRELAFNMAWKMEVKYTSRGMVHLPTPSQPFIQESNLRYIAFPVSLTYLYNDKVEVELGIAPDILISEYYADEDGPLDPSYAADLRRFGLNGFLGINYYFIERMAVGLRYTISVVPFYAFDYWTPRYVSSGYFHDVISVGIKYYFLK